MIKNPLNGLRNLADPSLELQDPAPNIYEMLHDFDNRFFGGTLISKGVELDWSPRMTQCAGLCRWDPRIQHCSIRLSNPLLALRSRRDLLETLLHEMIHAFLFVIRESDNRESHGPKFHQIMFKINAETQLSISVYHSFHDEVNFYKTHVWRCEGVCRNRAPYFGWLRRAMNRKPGPNDTWWSKHQQTCGGQYVKVSEPEKREKPKPGKEPKANNFVTNKTATSNGSSSKDIRQYFTPVTKSKDTSSQMPSFAAIPNNTSMFDDISYASDFSILMSPTKPTKPMIKTVFDSVQTNSDLLEQATAKSKPAFIPFAGDGHLLSISSSVCSQPNRKIISPLVNLFSSNKNMENQTNNKPIEITIVSETKKTKPPNHTVSGSANINVITLDDSFEYSSFNYEKRSLSISETNSLKKVCTKVHADCITLD